MAKKILILSLITMLAWGALVPAAFAAGSCSILRSWNTGDQLTAPDLTASFVTVGQTNMIPTCMDGDSVNVAAMQAVQDPWPAGSESLATNLKGEIERLRFAIKNLTGWADWYKNNSVAATVSGSALSQTYTWNNAGVTFPGAWKLNLTDTASNAASLLVDIQKAGNSQLVLDKTGNLKLALGAAGGATIATLTSSPITAARTYTFPDITGIVALTNGGQTFTSGVWNGSVIGTLYGGTGGNFSATAQGSLWYFSGSGTVAALAPGTSGQLLQTNGAAANPSWVTNPGFWTDPETSQIVWEDFSSVSGATANPATGPFTFDSGTWGQAGGASITYNGGTLASGSINVVTGAGSNGALSLWTSNFVAGSIRPITAASKNPTYYTSWAQLLNNAATRFIGLGDAELWQAPTNGIYFRHAASGSIIGVARSASVESTVTCGTSAAVGVFHSGRIVVTGGGTNVQFFIDGASCGSVTTNIPSANLGLSMGVGNLATADGLEVDYVVLKQTR
jgi:hypothetical protein